VCGCSRPRHDTPAEGIRLTETGFAVAMLLEERDALAAERDALKARVARLESTENGRQIVRQSRGLPCDCATCFDCVRESSAAAERAAIVAYLRKHGWAEMPGSGRVRQSMTGAEWADLIESGAQPVWPNHGPQIPTLKRWCIALLQRERDTAAERDQLRAELSDAAEQLHARGAENRALAREADRLRAELAEAKAERDEARRCADRYRDLGVEADVQLAAARAEVADLKTKREIDDINFNAYCDLRGLVQEMIDPLRDHVAELRRQYLNATADECDELITRAKGVLS
jgi:regulator of replication initiation timing